MEIDSTDLDPAPFFEDVEDVEVGLGVVLVVFVVGGRRVVKGPLPELVEPDRLEVVTEWFVAFA